MKEPIRLSDDVRVSPHDDGATILDIREGEVFGANAVAARIIALFEDGLDTDAIAEKIATEFHAPKERVRADLDAFVAALRSGKLIK